MKILLVVLLLLSYTCSLNQSIKVVKKVRYILFDVNPGEGFNLRRDVFMRVAIFVRKLNENSEDTSWKLVLPPWSHLYHWQTRSLGSQAQIPWSLFFDVPSINKFVPVLEFEEFLGIEGSSIGAVYYLQGYKEGWKDGHYSDKHDIRDCLEKPRYNQNAKGDYTGHFWGYEDVTAKKFACLSVQGSASTLAPFVTSLPDESIMLDRAENVLHDWFGDVNYWGVRRSMRFAKHLEEVADKFRKDFLGSNDEDDDTVRNEDWREHRVQDRRLRGGPYACVHLRRKDYVYSRKNDIPSIAGAAEQLVKKLQAKKLDTLFVATDAPHEEFQLLQSLMPSVTTLKFVPTKKERKTFKDGGVAIVDQSICSHARYFIGSYESTFTFRIQEEREIMGFPLKDTFDMLCADGKENCEKGSQWKVEWGEKGKNWELPETKLVEEGHSEL